MSKTPILVTQCYIVGVKNRNGEQVYLSGATTSSYSSTAPSAASRRMLVSDPANARQFEMDYDKSSILKWLDSERVKISKQADLDTLTIMLYETKTTAVPLDDPEWRAEIQRNAVSKLTNLEVEALSLEKYEIERRMAR